MYILTEKGKRSLRRFEAGASDEDQVLCEILEGVRSGKSHLQLAMELTPYSINRDTGVEGFLTVMDALEARGYIKEVG